MKCQFCDNVATVHLSEFVKKNKGKRQIHICDACARKHNLMPEPPAPQIDLKALLGLLVGQFQTGLHAEPATLTCPNCGLQYGQFRADGRLGCPTDYEAFRTLLEPLIERIHRSLTHKGKMPRAARIEAHEAQLRELRQQMQAAARAENYELAAQLRDQIRQKEASDEPR